MPALLNNNQRPSINVNSERYISKPRSYSDIIPREKPVIRNELLIRNRTETGLEIIPRSRSLYAQIPSQVPIVAQVSIQKPVFDIKSFIEPPKKPSPPAPRPSGDYNPFIFPNDRAQTPPRPNDRGENILRPSNEPIPQIPPVNFGIPKFQPPNGGLGNTPKNNKSSGRSNKYLPTLYAIENKIRAPKGSKSTKNVYSGLETRGY